MGVQIMSCSRDAKPHDGPIHPLLAGRVVELAAPLPGSRSAWGPSSQRTRKLGKTWLSERASRHSQRTTIIEKMSRQPAFPYSSFIAVQPLNLGAKVFQNFQGLE